MRQEKFSIRWRAARSLRCAGDGSGETTLIREICDRLGVADTVTSPTFAIINEYKDRGHRPVYHFDFYRINRIEEAVRFRLRGVFLQW